jgi:predicted transcriptional regulator
MGKTPGSRMRADLSDAELEVLKALWERGPSTVRQVNEHLRRGGRLWAYTTVLTLLQRLQGKGWVAGEAAAPAHVYQALATRQEWLQDRLQRLANQTCDGDRLPLLVSLVEAGPFLPEEIARFRELLDRLEQDDSGRNSP